MAIEFDIIKYICGLTDYTISESVATNIALRRGVSEVTEYEELTQKDNDLLLADVLTSLAFRPKKTASWSKSKPNETNSTSTSTNSGGGSDTYSKSHGGYSETITTSNGGGGGSSSSSSLSSGGYSESRGSEELGDIGHLLEYACELYEKWDEPIPSVLRKYNAKLEWLDDM
jgi:hypothetical protein